MNRRNIRVVDKVLSKIALGFQSQMHVGMNLFPRVFVDAASGKIIKFDKQAFTRINTKRAPGANTTRITVGYEDGNYSLIANALDACIPREWLRDQMELPHVNFQTQSVNTVMQIEANNLEGEQADLARDVNKYGNNHKLTLSGTDKWSDYDNSNPIADAKTAREAVRSTTAMYPNVALIPAKVHEVLCEHPKMLAKLSDNDVKILSAEDYQRIFDIEKVVIAKSVTVDDDDNFVDQWGTDVIFAYVPQVITTNALPSYGYTYVLEGHPSVEQMWYDRANKSWIAGVDYERQAQLTGIESGFIMPSVL